MSIEIKIPSVGESIQEAVLAEWFKQDGEAVRKDEVTPKRAPRASVVMLGPKATENPLSGSLANQTSGSVVWAETK